MRQLIYGAVVLLCVLPLGMLVWKGLHGGLGANPIEKSIRNLGVDGLRLLLVGLALTPLARLLRNPWIIRLRRPVGLFAFGYLSLHLLVWIGVDHYFNWNEIVAAIIKKPFITLGMAGFLLLIPLAFTSFRAAIQTLGPKRWQQLHRLVYVAVPLGIVHHYLLVKADHRPPLIYAAILVALLGWRMVNRFKAAG